MEIDLDQPLSWRLGSISRLNHGTIHGLLKVRDTNLIQFTQCPRLCEVLLSSSDMHVPSGYSPHRRRLIVGQHCRVVAFILIDVDFYTRRSLL
jgi:hypothetical protein